MRAYGLRLIAIEEARNYGKIVYIKNMFENGWWEYAYPHLTPPPGSAPGHKQRKPSKKSGIFQSLDTMNLDSVLLKGKVKGGAWHNDPCKCAPD